ncbi:MAG: cob(I)yrinic acid a,c-diamide adenosyltransferase [Nocardioidaceae bacterium]
MSTDPNTVDPATAPHFTREGDDGRTRFGAFGEVAKHDNRLAAYSDCEEANAAVGAALAFAGGLSVDVVNTLASVQHDMFDLASDLMAPADSRDESAAHITAEHIQRLERAIEHYSQDLYKAQGFVLPGGTVASSLIFQARTTSRRAERTVWTAVEEYGDQISPLPAQYLNRLSALLFVLARAANAEHGDTMWRPMASVAAPAEHERTGADA